MKEKIREILNIAVHAPSGHNYQPWRFKIFSDHVLLFIEPKNDETIYNFKQYGSYIAHGALIRNIQIASKYNMLDTSLELLPDSKNDKCTARISFTESKFHDVSSELEALYHSILKRSSNRKPYLKRPLTNSERGRLLENTEDLSDSLDTVFVKDSTTIETIANEITLNDRMIFSNVHVHNSVFPHIIWSKDEERLKKEGLYIKTLELPHPVQVMFRLLKFWKIASILGKVGMSNKVAADNIRTYTAVSSIGAIKCKKITPENLILGGMLLQQIWLNATNLGLYIHLVMGTLYLSQRAVEEEGSLFSKQEVKQLLESRRIFSEAFQLKGDALVIMFRLGEASPATARSSKKSI